MTSPRSPVRGGVASISPPATHLRGLRVVLVGPDASWPGASGVQTALLATSLQLEGVQTARAVWSPAPDSAWSALTGVGGALLRSRLRAGLRQAIGAGADVVHLASPPWRQFTEVAGLVLDAAQVAGIRTVVRCDSIRFDGADLGAISRVLRGSDAVVVPTTHLRDVVESKLGRAAIVIPDITEDSGVEAPPPRRAGRLRLFCACPLDRSPGVGVVLSAAATARARGVDLELVLSGDGPERSALERAATRHLPGLVSFLGETPRHRALAQLLETDLYVDAGDDSGSPITAADALAVGVPVAAAGSGSVACVVSHAQNGLVTPPGEAAALAASIVRLAADRDELLRFAWCAKIEALRWTWDALRDAWAGVYATDRA